MYGEGAVTDQKCQKWFAKFRVADSSLDDVPRPGKPVELIVIKSRHELRTMFYHAGDSEHTQNTQINKVIGENEKRIFYFMEKTKQTFWPIQYVLKEHLLFML